MISVPASTGSRSAPAPVAPQIDETYLLMAAAQMHKEGRLVEAPDYVGGPSQHEDTPPQEHAPSDGERTGPSMMT